MNTIKEAPLAEVPTQIITQEKVIVKTDAEIDSFLEVRQAFITKVNAICVEGKDYHVIKNKKSLAKGGAEKIASIFHWTAKFDQDKESLEMLGGIKGLVAFKCTLTNGQFVGEGRGSALLSGNGNDANKTLKMAQKSAFIDAVLRASGLSDFFTQDLEDMPKEQIDQPQYTHGGNVVEKPNLKATPKQAEFIKKLCKEKKLTQDKVLELAKGRTPSQLIEALLKINSYQTKQEAEELPTIQQEPPLTEEEINNIPF